MSDEKLNQASGASTPKKPGKVMRSEKQWRAIIEGQRESGLTIEQYCTANAISRSGFWKWRKQLGSVKAPEFHRFADPSFLAIPIKTETSRGSLELDIGAMRVRLDGFAAERVIDALVERIAAQA